MDEFIEEKAALLYDTTKDESDLSKIDTQNIDNGMASLFIDLYNINK